VYRDRIGREDEIEKPAPQRRQRGPDIRWIEFVCRESLEMALADAPDHRAKELFLSGEMRVDRRLGDAGLARNGVHADRAEPVREEGSRRCGEDAFSLSARKDLEPFHPVPSRVSPDLTACSRTFIFGQEIN